MALPRCGINICAVHAMLRAVPVLGQFRVDLSNIVLEGLDLSEAESGLALGPDGAFLLTVDQLKATVNAHFTYQRTSFPQVHADCTVHVLHHHAPAPLTLPTMHDGVT